MDVCTLNNKWNWNKYRNKTSEKLEYLRQRQEENEPFICYYRLAGNKTTEEHTIILLEKNTSWFDLILWCILPLLGISFSWLCCIFVACWFCCPPHRKRTEIMNAREITGSEHDPEGVKEAI